MEVRPCRDPTHASATDQCSLGRMPKGLPCSRIFHPLVIHIHPEYPRTRLKSLSFGSMSHILHPQSTRIRPYRIPVERLTIHWMAIIVTQLGKGDLGDRSSRITGSKWHGATTMDQAHPSTCAAWLQHALHSANIPTVEGVGSAHIQCIREVFMSASPDEMT